MRLYSVGNAVRHSIFVGHAYEDLIRDALPKWGYPNKSVCHNRGEYSHDEDGDGFHEVHVNTMKASVRCCVSGGARTGAFLRKSRRFTRLSSSSCTT